MKEQFAWKPCIRSCHSPSAGGWHQRGIFWVVSFLNPTVWDCRAIFWPGTRRRGQVPDFWQTLSSSTRHWEFSKRDIDGRQKPHARNQHYVGREELFLALRNSEKGGGLEDLRHLGKVQRKWHLNWALRRFRQLEDIMGRRNGFMRNCETELPRIAELSQLEWGDILLWEFTLLLKRTKDSWNSRCMH